MIGLLFFIHVLICVLLVTIILMQSGRGGGLTEQFSSAESMFGAKTNIVLVRATTVLGVLFLVTCLTLAYYSSRQGKSLVAESLMTKKPTAFPVTEKTAMPTNPAAEKIPAGENVKPPSPEIPTASEVPANPTTDAKPTGENAKPPSTETQATANPAPSQNPQ